MSELLQSQLLQPINLTPLQPRQAVSNLALISSSGPGTASFSEFNPLFTGDGYTAQLTGMGGEHSTWGGDAVVAGLFGKAAFSVGYSGFKTDGFRINGDQKDQIFDAFVQYDFTPQTSVQAEYRYRKIETGDMALRFFQKISTRASGTTRKPTRLGLGSGIRSRRARSSWLRSSTRIPKRRSPTTSLEFPVTMLTLSKPEKSVTGEVQYLYRSPQFNLVAGGGYADINGHLDTTVDLNIPPPDGPGEFQVQDTTSTDVKHTNAYAYAYPKLGRT